MAYLSACWNLKPSSKYETVAAGGTTSLPPAQARGRFSTSVVSGGGLPWVPTPVMRLQVMETCSRPVPVNALDIHTYGGRPEKSPTPPRTIVFPCPLTSQLNPKRGDQLMLPDGKLPVSIPSVSVSALLGLLL